LFIFGITIGANQSLLNNIGEFGIQAAILAICGVLGSLVASFIAYKLFIKKGGLNEK
jgi:CDP-diglyceride synthetase